jgi:putative addiction module component (TIGR02574 family)
MTAKDVIAEALRLPEAQRLELAGRLYESLEGPPESDADAAWAEEIGRRIASIDAGQATMMDWQEARRRIAGETDGDAAR